VGACRSAPTAECSTSRPGTAWIRSRPSTRLWAHRKIGRPHPTGRPASACPASGCRVCPCRHCCRGRGCRHYRRHPRLRRHCPRRLRHCPRCCHRRRSCRRLLRHCRRLLRPRRRRSDRGTPTGRKWLQRLRGGCQWVGGRYHLVNPTTTMRQPAMARMTAKSRRRRALTQTCSRSTSTRVCSGATR
jgi:hypothetical protein